MPEFRRRFIGIDDLFGDFKTDFLRITVRFGSVVDRNDITFDPRKLAGHGLAKIVRERANAALARQVSADKRNLARLGGRIHGAGKNQAAASREYSCEKKAPGINCRASLRRWSV